jgi:uncharacterized membrane protein
LLIKSRQLQAFCRDENGAVAVIVSLLLTVLIGFVALGVDVASLYRERAKLQADGDLVAMSSVVDPDAATARAVNTLVKNNRTTATLANLQTGRFLRNPAIAPADRFKPLPEGSRGINAVFVKLQDDTPLHFAKIFTDSDNVRLTRSSTAIRTGAASFSLTSNIARLDAAALNSVLSDSLNSSVTLSAGDINLLSETTVNMGDLLVELDRLAGNADRNPAAILDATTNTDRLFAALQSLLPTSASNTIESIPTGGPVGLPVEALIGGIGSALGLTAIEFASQIDLSALDILGSVVGANDFQHLLGARVAVPGVTSVTTRLAAGEPPARSGWVALGEEGVELNRAAVRLKNDIAFAPDLLGNLDLGVSVTRLELPIYVELAGATATLEEISCASSDPQATAARFSTAQTPLNPQNGTAVAALYLGKLPEEMFNGGPLSPSSLDFADLLDLTIRIDLPLLPDVVVSGITVQARSKVTLGASQTESLRFTQAEVKAGENIKYFGSGDLLSSGVFSLLSPSRTEVRIKPGQEGLVSDLVAPVLQDVLAALPAQLLAALALPLDRVIDTTLDTAGLQLGEGELKLTGHHCELVLLIQ